MKIAVTIWGNRVSPVFDAAKNLLMADIENQKVTNKQYLSFNPDSIDDFIRLLKKERIKTLICGAISNRPTKIIAENGIKLISFVSGDALELMEALGRRTDIGKIYVMPGVLKS